MFKDYYEVRNWLEEFIPYTYSKKNLGLARISYLLKLLENPQKKFKSIHVAGTSGKGSTAFYIAKLLQQETRNKKQETKVGLHVSPHLVDIRERMQIMINDPVSESANETGSLMPMDRFLRLFDEIYSVVKKIKEERPDLTPSYFEILVALSFKYFAEEKVDWAVVEVGLGGGLDATNVLQPEICVITNVGLDHTDILGKSIEKIAKEKAGIIKEGVPVITGARGSALKIIKNVAKSKKAPLITLDTQLGVRPLKSHIKDNLIIYKDIERYIPNSFASANFLLALAGVLALGFRPKKEAVLQISRSGLPGRFEEIDEDVILDGAHNPDKIQFLIDWIKNVFFARHSRESGNLDPRIREDDINGVVLVVAFKKGKNWEKMLDLLVKNLPIKKIIATKFYAATDTGRFSSVDSYRIAEYASSIVNSRSTIVRAVENSQEAVFEAINNQGKEQVVLITGSLYLIGEVRTMWRLPAC
ncbi:hypothetical protein A2696_04160 [Candidatus Curtissbacteria bacterium RIFCSPHIGHO2_01_FULL_41_13]|uniref:Mur ligase central domain-containing protein n=1 Tax=Candidatus Curtissbacteria bacterium RIFCSPHIGHO2_01_FULL_41_13 TaxID=1797745 RepID=A0A1F5FZ72_9BACT|nr:MAG: hypothetical protein A2696_04160 [Candidatus Curtissbacteria bacterium RIFCSPHIGHO2_01_FULL_41_13]